MLEKRVDALLGGADDQFFLIKYKGEEPAALRYADHGANIVGMTIVTQEATIKNKADLVRRFVKATVRSWEEAKKNPEAAVDATMKVKPDLNRASQLDQLKVDIELMDFGEREGPHRLRRPEGLGADARDAEAVSRRADRQAVDRVPHQRVPAEVTGAARISGWCRTRRPRVRSPTSRSRASARSSAAAERRRTRSTAST